MRFFYSAVDPKNSAPTPCSAAISFRALVAVGPLTKEGVSLGTEIVTRWLFYVRVLSGRDLLCCIDEECTVEGSKERARAYREAILNMWAEEGEA